MKAAKLIVERKPEEAAAGLDEDWGATGGCIWINGKPVPEDDVHVFLGSNWDIPTLDMDGERIPCWVMEKDSKWDSGTYWPPEALKIIEKG